MESVPVLKLSFRKHSKFFCFAKYRTDIFVSDLRLVLVVHPISLISSRPSIFMVQLQGRIYIETNKIYRPQAFNCSQEYPRHYFIEK